MFIPTLKNRKVNAGKVLFREGTNGRVYNYRKTYSKRIYYVGRRKFVIWDGMVCWLRNAYRGHYVIWEQEPIALAMAYINR